LKSLTPDDRLKHIPYAFRHTSAPLGWHGLRVEHDTQQPASEVLHPPLECLLVLLTGESFPEDTDHRCDDARHNGDGLPHAVNLLPPGVESQWRWRNTIASTHYQLSPALVAKVAEEAFDLDPARVHIPVRYYDRSSPEVIDTLTAAGVRMLRLDAVGYTGKEPGTTCFMTGSAHAFMARITEYAHERGAAVLVEVHGHHTQQIEIARAVDLVYDFALPPLILHALTAADLEPLSRWLGMRPTNCVTVLDTHDGIGVVDVGRSDLAPGAPGLLEPGQIDALVERIHENSRGTSRRATGGAASNLDLYQVNCTFYDALARDETRYLLARLIQLFLPGLPQVYYVGLLAGENDMDLLATTGVGRDVNRHRYSDDEFRDALCRPLVRAQLAALRLRREHKAFQGVFSSVFDETQARLSWENGEHRVELRLDVTDASFEVSATTVDGAQLRVDLLVNRAPTTRP
jgi:hypothetical protein